MAAIVFPITRSQRGDVGQLEEESFTGSLKVASADAAAVQFKALFGDAAKALDFIWASFNRGCDVFVEYAPDGVAKDRRVFCGRAIPMDTSFTTSLDQVGEFTVSFDGSGPLKRTTYVENNVDTAGTLKLNGIPNEEGKV